MREKFLKILDFHGDEILNAIFIAISFWLSWLVVNPSAYNSANISLGSILYALLGAGLWVIAAGVIWLVLVIMMLIVLIVITSVIPDENDLAYELP